MDTQIILENDDGSIDSISVRYGGIPENLGATLNQYYYTETDVHHLIELGDVAMVTPRSAFAYHRDLGLKMHRNHCLSLATIFPTKHNYLYQPSHHGNGIWTYCFISDYAERTTLGQIEMEQGSLFYPLPLSLSALNGHHVG